jgi:hypothetical protein
MTEFIRDESDATAGETGQQGLNFNMRTQGLNADVFPLRCRDGVVALVPAA